MNYESVYKNTGTVPRTMDEAYHSADYATAIHRYDTEKDDAVRFFKEFGLATLVIALLGMIGYSVWMLAVS